MLSSVKRRSSSAAWTLRARQRCLKGSRSRCQTSARTMVYGEQRFITVGWLDERLVVLVWTQRGLARRIISMRKANEREIAKYSQSLA